MLLTASLDGTACVWDVTNKKLHRQYRSHKGKLKHIYTGESNQVDILRFMSGRRLDQRQDFC
jgi:WD40 repeat protein